MPRYEVVSSAGLDFPVGMEFESDNLHPVMLQHVKQIGGKTAKPVEDAADTDTREQDPKKAYAAAVKLDKELFPPVAPVAPAKTGDGPGENS